jgi:hypothetical protein
MDMAVSEASSPYCLHLIRVGTDEAFAFEVAGGLAATEVTFTAVIRPQIQLDQGRRYGIQLLHCSGLKRPCLVFASVAAVQAGSGGGGGGRLLGATDCPANPCVALDSQVISNLQISLVALKPTGRNRLPTAASSRDPTVLLFGIFAWTD